MKKQWNMKLTFILIVIGAVGTVTKELLKGLEDMEIRRLVETIKTTVIEISQNTEKRPGDLRRFALTHTPVKD